MTHYMKLNPRPFDLMARGIKTIELRLNDEKRQSIKIGDVIIFSKVPDQEDRLSVKVVGLHNYGNFEDLYKALPLDKCGYLPEQIVLASPKDMEEYYSVEKHAKYGVLGIEVERIRM